MPTYKIVLVHPKYFKAICGKKADKKDAKWIADIFKRDPVSGILIPPADIRQLRDLVHYRWKLIGVTMRNSTSNLICHPLIGMYRLMKQSLSCSVKGIWSPHLPDDLLQFVFFRIPSGSL